LLAIDEYDFNSLTDSLYIGYSTENDLWFDDIQAKQHYENIRLGIFLNKGRQRKSVYIGGRKFDHLIYGLLAVEWSNK